MKVAIMTYASRLAGNGNYGAVLQCFALMTAIKKLGYECDVTDYRYKINHQIFMFPFVRARVFFSGNKEPYLYSFKDLVELWIERRKSSSNIRESVDFMSEFKEKIDWTIPVSRENIKELNDLYDFFISGSDQVWSPSRVYPEYNYMLDFVKDNRKKGAYAASFGVGRDELPKVFKKQYRKLLSGYRFISVREKSAQTILKELIGRGGDYALDPTLLFDKAEWFSMIDNSIKNETDQKYIVVYTVFSSRSLNVLAEKVAKIEGLKVRYITVEVDESQDIIYEYPNPEEWIKLIANAEYVLTNSFHGTAFSVNFEKQFLYELSDNDLIRNTISRIYDLLTLIGLDDRIIRFNSPIDKKISLLKRNIDYTKAQEIIGKERQISWSYLEKMLDARRSELSDD